MEIDSTSPQTGVEIEQTSAGYFPCGKELCTRESSCAQNNARFWFERNIRIHNVRLGSPLCLQLPSRIANLLLMIAEISTGLWFAYVAYLLVQHFILGNLSRYEAKYKFVVSWLSYCIPIHIHGTKPRRLMYSLVRIHSVLLQPSDDAYDRVS